MRHNTPQNIGSNYSGRYRAAFAAAVVILCVSFSGAFAFPSYLVPAQIVGEVAERLFSGETTVTPPLTFTVNQNHDAGDGTCDATCTLRDAVTAANSNPFNDTIEFLAGMTTVTLSNEIILTGAANGTLSINGPGASLLTINGGPGTNRIFSTSGTVTISAVTLTGGNGGGATLTGMGGAIYATSGNLTLTRVKITGNSATGGNGGGIYNHGTGGTATLTLHDSAVSNNTSSSTGPGDAGNAGAIYNNGSSGSATLTINNSVINNNVSELGPWGGELFAAGIYNNGAAGNATIAIRNSTLTGNENGEGIFNAASSATSTSIAIINSTISDSFFSSSGTSGATTINIGNSILFATSITGTTTTVNSLGYNLCRFNGSGFLTAPTDLINTDPLLGPLQDNGGPTLTQALPPGSPAIDKGKALDGLTTDQRGLPRSSDDLSIANATGGDGSDIGSFEIQVPAAGISIAGGPLNFGNQLVGTTSTAQTLTVTNTGTANLVVGTPLFVTGTQFGVSGVPSTPIAPGNSANLSITFTPTSVGVKADTVTIVSNAPGPAPTVSLSGTGINSRFRSAASGYWTSTSTWEQSNDGGTTWGIATLTPTAANSDSIIVRNEHQVAVNTSITVDQVSIGSGKISVDSGGTLTVTDGPGTDLTVESLNLNSRLDVQQGGSLVNNGQLHVNGWFYRFGGSTITGNSFVYGFPSILSYAFGTQTTTDVEFPETNPPSGIEVFEADVTLHEPRTLIQVALGGTGSFNIGSNLTMQDGSFIFRTSADAVFNGTPNYGGNVSLIYQNENITTGSEATNAITFFQVIGVQVTLGSDVTANHQLRFDSGGKVITGPHTFTLMNGDNVLSDAGVGWVVGNLRKTFVSNSLVPSAHTFEVGTANGYSPVTVTFGGLGTYQQTVKAVQGAHPNVSDPTKALARHWTLSNITGPGPVTADATFNYLTVDVPVTANESNFLIQKFSGGFTQPGGSVNTVANTATITGVSSFSDWTLAESGAIGVGPVVTTTAASSVTGTTATLNGSANPNGGATTGWFRYSLSDPGTCNDVFGTRTPTVGGSDLGSGTSDAPFSQGLTGLMPDATVYYCAIAQNSSGTSFGAVLSFTPDFFVPVVTTNAASSVISTGATLNGSANPGGSSTTGWFRYSTASPGTCNDVFGTRAPLAGGSSLGSGNSDAPYSQSVSGLSPATTYFYCAIAQNSEGIGFGALLQFTTAAAAAAPTTNSSSPSAVSATGGTLNGSANPNGASTTGWFRYSTTNPITCDDVFGTRAPTSGGTALGAGTSSVDFSRALAGLAPATTYFYCAIAQNASGTSFGNIFTLTTSPAVPVATTNAASSVTSTGATLNGSANPGGSSTTGWFRYSTVNPGTCNDTFGARAPLAGGSSLGSGNSDAPYSQSISGLSPVSTYFYCAIGQNSEGTGFGAVLQFTTAADVPTTNSSSPSAVSATGGTLNGSANPNGASTTGWFRYSTTNPITCDDVFGTRAPTSGGSALGAGTSPVTFSRALTGLAPGTTYFYCAIAQNSAGTSFGSIFTLTTSSSAPVVTTGTATSVTALAATLNGSAIANGSPTTGWFRYATTNPGTCNDTFGTRAPTSGGTSIGNGTSSAPFSRAISGLTQSTTYFVCAIAQNAIGTSFGSVMQFTTPALNAGISVTPNSLSYGNQTYGTTSAAQSVTITSTGTDPLVLGSLSLANGTHYFFSQNPSGQTVQPGQSVTASIVFTPTLLGVRTDTLTILSNASSQPQVSLDGIGVIADIDVPLADIDFETVSMVMGGVRLLTVSNFGTEDLIFTGAFSGPHATEFSSSQLSQPVTVQPGQSTGLAIIFSPTATGQRSGVLTLTTNDPDEPTVALSLIGVAVNPGFLQFSSVSYSGNEGDGTIALTVQRIGGSNGAVSAFFSASGGLATGGEACGGAIDYVNQLPFANFADGDTEPKTVLITVCDDAIVENSETFDVQLNTMDADVGANTQAVVAIADNDVAGQISISGTITKADNSPLTGHNVGLAGASVETTATDASGQFTFADVPGGSYIVTPATDPAYLFDPISRNYSNRTTNVTDAHFKAYAPGTQPRTVTVFNGFATPGQQALVPIMLQSQGNEASLTFSLAYDQTLLSGATVECGSAAGAGCSLTVNTATPGKIGISVDPVAATFAAGNREVVRVLFFTSPTASVLNTPVTLTNDPAISETSDADANPLLTRYVSGSVIFIQGIESDVAGRPNGDGVVTSTDVAQVRRFAVGLDTYALQSNEFQRADSSPYATAGDGVVAATDITQARRYQIGTDPTQPAGGPGAPAGVGAIFEAERTEALSMLQAPRVVRVVNASASRGSQVTVALQTDAEGDENVYGFSLNYDPAILSNPVVTIGTDAVGGNVLSNTTQSGKIGFSVDFGSSAMPAGLVRELVKVRFDVSSTAPAGQTPLGFGDAPAFRETSNAGAQALETSYTNGFVTILAPTAANASISGRVTTSYGRAISGAYITVQDINGASRTIPTNTFGYFTFNGLQAGQSYVVSISARRYQFAVPTRVVDLSDNIVDLNFVASP